MTKLYLHATTSGLPSGTLPSDEQSTLTPDSNDFEGGRTTNRLMNTTIGVSQANLTNTSTGDSNAHNYYITRFVSPILYQAKVSAQTWTMEYGAKESNAAANFPRSSTGVMYVCAYVWRPSTGTKYGNILDGNSNSDGEEAGTSQSVINFTFSGAEVANLIPGDAILVVEIWAQVTQGNTSTRTQDFYYDGTTEGSTTNEAAFISTPENLRFSATDGNASTITLGGNQACTANTTQYLPIAGSVTAITTTEANVKIRFRQAGVLSNLVVRLSANSVAGASTFTMRKNSSDTSLLATATASTAGVYEDVVNTVSVAAGDDIDIKSVPGAASNTYTISSITCIFTPTDPTALIQLLACTSAGGAGIDISGASTTRYIPLGGSNANSATESNAQVKQKKAATYSKLYVYVVSNARTTNTTFRSRKNGSNGNLSVTFGNGETGLKEDTSNSDTVAVDDNYNLAVETSTGTETLVFSVIKVECNSSIYHGIINNSNLGGTVVNANLTRNIPIGADLAVYSTETDCKARERQTRILISNLHIVISANTVTADSTLKLRLNGANTALSATITNATTGLFSDTSNLIQVGSNDDINLQLITGATGTSLTIREIYFTYTTGRVSMQFRWPYNIAQRVSKQFRWPWNTQQRVSKTFRWVYNILQRISKQFRWPYNVAQRVSKQFRWPYNVAQRVSKTFRWPWNTLQRVSKQFRWPYNVEEGLERVSKTFRWVYNVAERKSKTFRFPYNTVERVSKQFRFLWNTLQRVSMQFRWVYNVAQRVSKQFRFLYNVVARVSKQFRFVWNTLQRVSKQFRWPYNIVGRISKQFRFVYNVVQRVSKTFRFPWNTLQRVSMQFRWVYNVLQRVSKEFTFLYDIIAEATRISKTFRFVYNVVERKSKQFRFPYNITVRVEKQFRFVWNTLQRVSLTFRFPWNTVQRVSKQFRFVWNRLQRVSLSFNWVYNVVQRVSLSFNWVYNVESDFIRVSKTFRFVWNRAQRVSKKFRFHWRIEKPDERPPKPTRREGSATDHSFQPSKVKINPDSTKEEEGRKIG